MGDRVEAWVQVLILLGVGGMAGAVSFTHVHDWTIHNGQLSWVGWTNALVTELTQIAGGLEVRRRKRNGQPTTFVVGVLIAAVFVSLTAQVSQAAPTVPGWLVAALLSLGFLVVVKIVMSRTAAVNPAAVSSARTGQVATRPDTGPAVDLLTSARSGQIGPARSTPVNPHTEPVRSAPVVRSGPGPDHAADGLDRADDRDQTAEKSAATPDHGPDRATRDQTAVTDVPDRNGPIDDDLLTLGRQVRDELAKTGEKFNRDTLAAGIRARGGTIGTDAARFLLKRLKEEAAA